MKMLVPLLLLGMCAQAAAQAPPGMPKFPPFKRIATPDEAGAVLLYPGVAPGSEGAKQVEVWSEIFNERVARNVTRPTLMPFLPAPGKATGAAVVVAPGGAYLMLAMDPEGYQVAKALAEQGIAAFVLKYRLNETADDEREFQKAMDARFGAAANAGADRPPPPQQPLAVKDALVALALVRARAAEWKVDPARVGIIGFSAGAMTALGSTLANDPARPDFLGLIYGPMSSVTMPAKAPPLFLAIAADDPLFGRGNFGIVESWKSAGAPVEMHLYESGGHGFGMRHQGKTSDLWIGQFQAWLGARGLLAKTASASPPPMDMAAIRAGIEKFNKLPDTIGTGKYPALKEEVPSLPNHVIYRPADLSKLGREKLGILAWGNGGCAADGTGARLHLLEIASHGYLAIANGKILSGPGAPPNAAPPMPPPPRTGENFVPPPPATKAEGLREAIDWALAENTRAGSPYFGRIDPKRIAVSGWSCGGLQALQIASDPRVRTVLVHNSGIFGPASNLPPNPEMNIGKATLAKLHTPVIYVLGGPTDIAYANGMDDFAKITEVPAMVANLDVGHVGTFIEPNGGAAASVAVSWLDWQLKGDQEAAKRFTGKDCGLCKDPAWKVERKRID